MSMEVEAFIFGKKIGTILLKDGVVYFEYDKAFKTSGLEISPLKLPLSIRGVYTNNDDKYFEGLAGVFYDTLPDKFGTKVIERYFESKNIAPHEINIIQKLMFVSNKSIGAIKYKPIMHHISKEKTDKLIDLQNFYENAKKIITGNTVEAVDEILSFMDSAASAGGARAKAVIGYNNQTKEMTSGVNQELKQGFEHYLIKFDMQNDDGSSPDYTKIEYIYMNMAREVGINIPVIELLPHRNLSHYLIKRFDRVNNKALHLHSVAGLTHTNFNIPMHYSYDELLRLTRYLTGSQSAVNEQFKRMVFNIVARNQDDHAKNFAFLMDETGAWSLSPAYDITYSNGTGYTKNHQLSLNGKTNNFTSEDILQLAKKHSIKDKVAKEYIEEVAEVFCKFPTRAKELEVKKQMIDRIYNALRLDLR